MLEVLDRRAFAQEFRIGDDRHRDVRPQLAQNPFDLVAGPDRHRRFGDDDRRVGQERRKLTGRGVDKRQVGMAVAAPRRRADRDEHRIGLADGSKVGREGKPPLLPVGGDELGKPGLVDRDFALIEGRDLVGVAVDAGDVVTEIRKAGPGDKPDVAGTDHHHAHENSTAPVGRQAACRQ